MQRRTRSLRHAAAAIVAAAAVATPALAGHTAPPAPAVADPIVISTTTRLTPADRDLDHRDVIVDGATLIIDGSHRFRSLWLRNGAVVTHGIGQDRSLDLTIDESLRIDPACAVTATGRAGATVDRAPSGGAVRLTVGGVVSLDGWIAANGKPGTHPGESGGNAGSIQIVAAALVGQGRISARGGDPGPLASAMSPPGGGEGGDVRIRVGAARGNGVITAAPGAEHGWSNIAQLAAAPRAHSPVLEIDATLYPEARGVKSQWAMWRVEGSPGPVWAAVEE